MTDWQVSDFPMRQPYEGVVKAREDPEGLHRVKCSLPGYWEPHGPWCAPVGGWYSGGKLKGTFASPPLNATVLLFFVGLDPENPRYLPGHHGEGQVPLDGTTPEATITNDGDKKLWQDERVRIEIDGRGSTYGVRVTDLATGTTTKFDVDMSSAQVGISTALGVEIKSAASVRVDAPLLTLNGRIVLPGGPPI
jgi:hypothetical protein